MKTKLKSYWRRCATTILLTLSATTVNAEPTALRLLFRDGTTTTYLLDEQPILTFENECLNIATTTLSTTYDIEAIEEYDFIEEGRDLAVTKEGNIRFERFGDDIIIHGCTSKHIALYDLNGRTMAITIDTSKGAIHFSLEKMPKGTYILRMNQQSIKLIKK